MRAGTGRYVWPSGNIYDGQVPASRISHEGRGERHGLCVMMRRSVQTGRHAEWCGDGGFRRRPVDGQGQSYTIQHDVQRGVYNLHHDCGMQ